MKMLNLKENLPLKYITFFITLNAAVAFCLSLILLMKAENNNTLIVVASGIMILIPAITLVINIYVLKHGIYHRKQLVFNFFICLAQSFFIFTDSVYYKYTQAVQWVLYYTIDDPVEGTGLRYGFPVINGNLTFKILQDENLTVVGANILMAVISLYLLRCLVKNKNNAKFS